MKLCPVLLIGLLTLGCVRCLETPRIAIVGGGIGGASTSHFLTELGNGNLRIDLYEAGQIGGRLANVKIGNDEREAGGSIIHPRNLYMQEFTKLLGLEHNLPNEESSGIWNGDEFVFQSGNWFVSLVNLLYKYGFQVFKLQRDVNHIFDDFVKIYKLQDTGKSFMNVTALLSAMNKEFPKLLQTSTKDYLQQMGYSKILIDQLAEAVLVVNYGQDTDIQAFVGLVSLAAADSELWSVKGGNKEVPERLIYRNKNVNVIPRRVMKICYIPDSSNSQQYEVTYMSKDSTNLVTNTYDIVIIAAPLTNDQEFPIEFVNFPKNLEFPGSYQTTHATFIKGDLKPQYFGLKENLDCIVSCNPSKTIISAIAKADSVNGLDKDGGSPVWKIFSRKPMETDIIHKMFSNITEKTAIPWKAYPHYSSKMLHNSFKLHNALYHVNAIEWAASAMEMSAISGRNVAILAYNDYLQKHGIELPEEVPEDIPKITDEL